jgi:iron complex outermembrane receptor protein
MQTSALPSHRPAWPRAALVVCLAGAMMPSLLAQTAPATEPKPGEAVVLNPFEVIAEKSDTYQAAGVEAASKLALAIKDVPQTVTVLTEQFLQDIAAQDLSDAMLWVTGAEQNLGPRNQDGFSIRGFGASLTYNDGFRDGQEWGSGETSHIARLEVLKGPASNLYGNMRGFGGVVNRVTKKPSERPAQSVTFTVGSHDSYRFTHDKTGPLSADKSWLYRINSAFTHQKSFRDQRGLQRIFVAPVVTKKLSENTSVRFSLELLKTDTKEDLGVPVQIDPATNQLTIAALPRSRQVGEPWEHTRLEKQSARVYVTHRVNDNWSVRTVSLVTFWNNPTEHIESLGLTPDGRTLRRQAFWLNRWEDHFVAEVDVIGKFTTGPLRHNLLLGYEFNLENGRSNVRRLPLASIDIYNPVYNTPKPSFVGAPAATNLKFRNGAYAPFISNQVSFWQDRVAIFGGVRWDRSTRHQIIELPTPAGLDRAEPAVRGATPRYGFVIRPDTHLRIYAQHSESFRPITNATTPTFDALKPETGELREAGIKRDFFNGRLNAEVAYYKITQSNLAFRLPAPLNSFFTNQGEQWRVGQEFNLGFNGGGWNLIGGYIRSKSQQDLNPGITPPTRTPYRDSWQFSGKFTFAKDGKLGGLAVGLGVRPREQIDYGALGRVGTLPAYTRYDLNASYRVNPRLGLQLNIYNLTDELYYRGVVSPMALPGAPRTFRLTARYTL